MKLFEKSLELAGLKEKSKQQVLHLVGHSNYHSEFDVWAYDLIQNIFSKKK